LRPWITTSKRVFWIFSKFELGKLRKTRSKVFMQGRKWKSREKKSLREEEEEKPSCKLCSFSAQKGPPLQRK
jgi:hypothetical protein